MSFNLTIKSDDAINHAPNPIIIDPLLTNFYRYEFNNINGNLLRNEANYQYDLLLLNQTDIVASKLTTNITLANSFTLGCWFKVSAVPNFSRILSFLTNTTNSNDSIDVYLQTGALMLSIFNGSTPFQQLTTPVLPFDTWTFFAWKIDGLTWTFYYNNTVTTYSKTNVAIKTKTNNYIGRTQAGGPLTGQINKYYTMEHCQINKY